MDSVWVALKKHFGYHSSGEADALNRLDMLKQKIQHEKAICWSRVANLVYNPNYFRVSWDGTQYVQHAVSNELIAKANLCKIDVYSPFSDATLPEKLEEIEELSSIADNFIGNDMVLFYRTEDVIGTLAETLEKRRAELGRFGTYFYGEYIEAFIHRMEFVWPEHVIQVSADKKVSVSNFHSHMRLMASTMAGQPSAQDHYVQRLQNAKKFF